MKGVTKPRNIHNSNINKSLLTFRDNTSRILKHIKFTTTFSLVWAELPFHPGAGKMQLYTLHSLTLAKLYLFHSYTIYSFMCIRGSHRFIALDIINNIFISQIHQNMNTCIYNDSSRRR